MLAAAWLVRAADGFELLTAAEYQEEKDAQALVLRSSAGREQPESERVADGPVIDVVTPDATHT